LFHLLEERHYGCVLFIAVSAFVHLHLLHLLLDDHGLRRPMTDLVVNQQTAD
jgi:hypothetical protein